MQTTAHIKTSKHLTQGLHCTITQNKHNEIDNENWPISLQNWEVATVSENTQPQTEQNRNRKKVHSVQQVWSCGM